MKINFDIFQIQKWISQIVRAQKVDEKNGIICQVPFFSFLNYGPEIDQNSANFANFCWP